LLGLNKKTYELSGVNTPGNVPGSYKEPAIGWMTGFLLAVSFVGLLTLLPLRKVLLSLSFHVRLLFERRFLNFLWLLLLSELLIFFCTFRRLLHNRPRLVQSFRTFFSLSIHQYNKV